MRFTPSYFLIVLAPFIFANCRTSKTGSGSVGSADFPFDEKGNYREDWVKADEEGRRVVDLTENNPPSPFLGTTDPRDAHLTSSHPSRPTVRSTGISSRSKSTRAKTSKASASKTKSKVAAKPKPKFVTTTVKSGDTLYGLSKRYGVSVPAIQKANGMGSSTILRDGRTIKIPK